MSSPDGSAPVTGFGFSSDYYVNDLLPEDVRYRWGGSLGTPVTISYSFPTSSDPSLWSHQAIYDGYGSPGNPDGEPWNGFQALNTTQQGLFQQALQSWADVANITFTQVGESSSDVGDIRVAGSSEVTNSDAAAWAY